ncbi:hypothetical protein NUU61_002236, partial [Penicillium alfredii]
LPKIGTILRKNDDGSYEQGPIPGLGGPFETATEFFKFGLSEDRLKEAAGSLADELLLSTSFFKSLVGSSAGRLSDDNYQLLGVIDWETAFAEPWEISGEFPLTLSVVPPDMDAPWDYDERGFPKDKFVDREDYIAMVIEKEKEIGLTEGYRLSMALQDSSRQYLATAMRLYQRGKPGWYSKVMERISKIDTC